MKIALLGGTGDFGEGLALRWAASNEIIIGSRELEKAEKAAKRYTGMLKRRCIYSEIRAFENFEAAKRSEVVVFSIPYEYAIPIARQISGAFDRQIVISPLVPMKKNKEGKYEYSPSTHGCAALELREVLPVTVRLVSALQTLPAEKVKDLDLTLDLDVVVCSDDKAAKQVVLDLIRQIPCLRPLDGGPLELSCSIENLTPLLLNLSRLNKLKDLSVKFL